MNPITIIERKRDGLELSEEQLNFMIARYIDDQMPDYQMAAFLMAVYLQGMTDEETTHLTRLMRDSGTLLDFSDVSGFKVDKHSTGGVGDKVSLPLAPLLASDGVIIPMISGRGLAHTGGTLDKLEAIPGFRTRLSLPEIHRGLAKIGCVLVGQTQELCPADKKIYALRDATGTVSSIPLICASILSKKLAEGLDALVIDVKAGTGAIFDTPEMAQQLAEKLINTAEKFGLKAAAIISNMDQPLGRAVGNWLETLEAIEVLRGNGPEDVTQLTLVLGAQLLLLTGRVTSLNKGIAHLQHKLNDGSAYQKFLEIVDYQGGDTRLIENPASYPATHYQSEIKSSKSGFVSRIHARQIGQISMALGAGRTTLDDAIDYGAGIVLQKQVGDAIKAGEILCRVYAEQEQLLTSQLTNLQTAFTISEQPAEHPPLIYSRISFDGEKTWSENQSDFV